MPVPRTTFRVLALAIVFLAAASAAAQAIPGETPDPAIPRTIAPKPKAPAKPAAPKQASAMNPNLILLDPNHGGPDNGAALAQNAVEKDVTLALAKKLRTLLTARGFTVILTRDNSTDDVSQDARIELANRVRPLACLLLHAAGGGHGVHLYTSALTPSTTADPNAIAPWDTAQGLVLPQSTRLLSDLSTALAGIRIPLVSGRSSVRPIDSLTCPAVALELAPLQPNGDINTPVSDDSYQQHVAEAVTQALVFWRGHAESGGTAAVAPARPASPPPVTKPKPKPKPIVPPVEVPDESSPTPRATPAPVVRRPAAPPTGAPQ